jgi:hypothetical protein
MPEHLTVLHHQKEAHRTNSEKNIRHSGSPRLGQILTFAVSPKRRRPAAAWMAAQGLVNCAEALSRRQYPWGWITGP